MIFDVISNGGMYINYPNCPILYDNRTTKMNSIILLITYYVFIQTFTILPIVDKMIRVKSDKRFIDDMTNEEILDVLNQRL